jgi:hypothetical protein
MMPTSVGIRYRERDSQRTWFLIQG